MGESYSGCLRSQLRYAESIFTIVGQKWLNVSGKRIRSSNAVIFANDDPLTHRISVEQARRDQNYIAPQSLESTNVESVDNRPVSLSALLSWGRASSQPLP